MLSIIDLGCIVEVFKTYSKQCLLLLTIKLLSTHIIQLCTVFWLAREGLLSFMGILCNPFKTLSGVEKYRKLKIQLRLFCALWKSVC